jgi:hypothetical protein
VVQPKLWGKLQYGFANHRMERLEGRSALHGVQSLNIPSLVLLSQSDNQLVRVKRSRHVRQRGTHKLFNVDHKM